mgnify:CR=1 FL=1
MTSLENVGYIGVVITVALTFISYVTPYWSVYGGLVSSGLLAHCEPHTCTWFVEDDNAQYNLPGERLFTDNII